ncbi:hypothetical protein NKI15_00475 [Mesorhizobium sp. M0862]|uniref:DEAD/DEAH box helicase n=1 Tax=Mesorhizobium sp. M0862 TaxID=2957015 RepID=UPI00333933D6
MAVVNVPLPDDVELPSRAIYVLTQERVHAILAAHPNFTPEVIICDEAQNIQDGSRGILLHGVVDRLIERNPDAQLIFAGPNIKNLNVFAETFGIPDVHEIHSLSPSVIQNMMVINTRSAVKGLIRVERILANGRQDIGQDNINRVTPTTTERLVWIAERFGREKPSIIYANRPVDAEKVAKGLAQVLPPPVASTKLMDLAEFVRVAVHAKYDLADCLEHGVGFHYGRIPALVRRGVEEAFAQGEIKFLVTTSTLIQGVNFPAANLFVCKPKKGNVTALTGAEFWNLAGRAGRLGKEFQGNVFLIDYDEWSNKPAEEANEIQVASFLESSLLNSIDMIEECALREPILESDGVADIESAFSRLLSDLVSGRLSQTLAKYDVSEADRVRLTAALSTARAKVSLPWSVLALSPTVSALRQQRLADYLHAEITGGGIERLEQLIPRNPRDGDSYKVLSDIYRTCHQQIWTLTAPKLHMRMAAISLSWMRGDPLPEIIEENHRRIGGNLSSNIRTTLNDIEQEVRFKYLRLIICYIAILSHVLRQTNNDAYLKGISSLPSYMEMGASDQTMISFINIGLSRLTARTLTDELIDKNMGLAEVLTWLRAQNLDDIVTSEIIRSDIRRALLNLA